MASKQNIQGMSPEAIEKLKAVEGFRSKPYTDGKNSKSIGHGVHEAAHPDIYHKYGNSVTKEQAHQQVTTVIERHERDLINRLGLDTWNQMNQGQRDAIHSAAYNAGPRRTAESIGSDLKAGNYERAADMLEKMAPRGMVGDKTVDLAERRQMEARGFRQSGTQSNTNCSLM